MTLFPNDLDITKRRNDSYLSIPNNTFDHILFFYFLFFPVLIKMYCN